MSRLIDWKTMCLVCLKKDENRSIFNRDTDSNVIVDKIIKCADIFIEKDTNQPKSICLQCLDNLNVTYKFYRNYEQSDSIIKALLSANHQGFHINDLSKTTHISGAQENESPKDEIFYIEQSANSNEINIKHEIIENDVIDDTRDNDNSPYIDLGDNIDIAAKLVQKDPPEVGFPDSAIGQNDVKANEGNKIKQDASDEISGTVRSESKASIENACNKQSSKAVYKKALKICEICNRGFKYQARLTIHMRRHNNERSFSCDLCDKAYTPSADLLLHMRAHTGEKPYKCQYCDRRFTQTNKRKRHERTHTGERPYQCQYCDRRFAQKCHRKSHERTHTGERPYQCQYCDRRFAEKNNRKAHERMHTGEKPFVCSTCGKSFTYSHGLAEHRQIHTGVKKFMCEECGKAFDKRLLLERHVARHLSQDKLDKSSEHKPKKLLGKEILQIEECAKSDEINIKHKIKENDVVNDAHDNDNSPCIDLGDNIDSEAKFALKDQPEARFQGNAIEQNDVKPNESNKNKQDANDEFSGRVKSESKDSIENSCDKPTCKTLYKKALKICEICNRAYKYQARLITHMRRHNNERPFSCDRCEKTFVSSTFLRIHMRRHTGEKPYECQYCDRRFTQKNNQKRHERTHMGERPFVCPTCGKTFPDSNVLAEHRQIHTALKKFMCEECGKAFDKRLLLERHVARHLSLDELDKSSEHKPKKVLEKEIFQIDECAKSNEINIKHKIIELDVVDDTHNNANSPCIQLGDNIDSAAKFALKDPAEACFQGGAIQQNDIKASERNKIEQNE